MLLLPSYLRRYNNGLFHFFLAATICSFWAIYAYRSVKDLNSLLQLALYTGIFVVITFLNVRYLFERLFLRDRRALYILSSLGIFIAGSFMLQGIYVHSLQEYVHTAGTLAFNIEFITQIILFITFSGLGITLSLLKLLIESKQKISELAQINLKTELENLKSQVSPHFIFNTLNNLYVLTKTKPDLAAESILQLSDLIKYQLYECSQDRVPLKKELDYIRNILSLEQLRKDQWKIDIDFDNNIPGTLHIEPLLIIILIENAIKHGVQNLQSGVMTVTLRLQDDKLVFSSTNSKPYNSQKDAEKKSIGLNNLSRRLQLLYPGRHQLHLEDKGTEFCATITIDL